MSFTGMRFESCVLRILLLAVATVFLASGAQASESVKKSPLRILFVGHNPQTPAGEEDLDPDIGPDPARAEKLLHARSEEWESFLKKYFETVDVVYPKKYKEAMSSKYDVTIFDVLPPQLPVDKNASKAGGPPFQYLSKDYSAATIMIGGPSSWIGEGRELKIDSLCLCLDAHAYGMKLDHPIFNTPYNAQIELEQRETPADARTFNSGRNLGPTMAMWRVQTEGYQEGKGFPIGLVSTGYGFDNGIDAEWISGGVSTKGPDAAAIGRHANFLLWGFAASPPYMTESAKLAFVNAVHYIAPYSGARQITSSIKSVESRASVLEREWTLSDEGAALYVTLLNELRLKDIKEREKALAKRRAGEPLNPEEQMMADIPVRPPYTREQTIAFEPEALKKEFGDNYAAYGKYYTENMGYFFSQRGTYEVSIDADAKALGIANNDIRLLDAAVEMWRKGDRAKTAEAILRRYTKESFTDVDAWAEWLKQNRDQLYFSEGDGFKWIVIPQAAAAWLKENCDSLYASECNGYQTLTTSKLN